MSAALDTLKSQMAQYLTGLDQGPLNALNALAPDQQEAYAQAITAWVAYNEAIGKTTAGWPSDIDTSERGNKAMKFNGWSGGNFDQACLDAQAGKNSEEWCKANGWNASTGMPGGDPFNWIGKAGQWQRVACRWAWNNSPLLPGTAAIVDLDVNSANVGDDSIHAYKNAINNWVQTGGGMAYSGVWPAGFGESWNTAFQALHSQGHIFAQIAGPFIAIAGAVGAAVGIPGASGLITQGIQTTIGANQNPPAYVPGQGAKPVSVAVNAPPPPAAENTTTILPTLSAIPWAWVLGCIGLGLVGILAFEEAK